MLATATTKPPEFESKCGRKKQKKSHPTRRLLPLPLLLPSLPTSPHTSTVAALPQQWRARPATRWAQAAPADLAAALWSPPGSGRGSRRGRSWASRGSSGASRRRRRCRAGRAGGRSARGAAVAALRRGAAAGGAGGRGGRDHRR
ncbi:hypothetical protein PVAP13_6NG146403 [Panicum virgatum]|uniref:Uncharacterized protein n=1 Tax=Panicum virgatum TaxID=38727 RepID=A0A8T0R170_PANVG|nr:hypothetical protein PVAP13_6NG146403 [Panicum virgatum]